MLVSLTELQLAATCVVLAIAAGTAVFFALYFSNRARKFENKYDAALKREVEALRKWHHDEALLYIIRRDGYAQHTTPEERRQQDDNLERVAAQRVIKQLQDADFH